MSDQPADALLERPDRILILRRGDLRIAIPMLDAIDPTPLGVILSALPTILGYQAQAPAGADLGPPLDDDASVLMLRVVGGEDPLVPDVGLFAQTEGQWDAGNADGPGRTELTARVPELEVELIDVERPVIALRGFDLELNVLSDAWDGNAAPALPGIPEELVGPLPEGATLVGVEYGDLPTDEAAGTFDPELAQHAAADEELIEEELTAEPLELTRPPAFDPAGDANLLAASAARRANLSPEELETLDRVASALPDQH